MRKEIKGRQSNSLLTVQLHISITGDKERKYRDHKKDTRQVAIDKEFQSSYYFD